jgi:hypothetical protein
LIVDLSPLCANRSHSLISVKCCPSVPKISWKIALISALEAAIISVSTGGELGDEFDKLDAEDVEDATSCCNNRRSTIGLTRSCSRISVYTLEEIDKVMGC